MTLAAEESHHYLSQPLDASDTRHPWPRNPITGPATLILAAGAAGLLGFGILIGTAAHTETGARVEIAIALGVVVLAAIVGGLCWLLNRAAARRHAAGLDEAEAWHTERHTEADRSDVTLEQIATELVTIHTGISSLGSLRAEWTRDLDARAAELRQDIARALVDGLHDDERATVTRLHQRPV